VLETQVSAQTGPGLEAPLGRLEQGGSIAPLTPQDRGQTGIARSGRHRLHGVLGCGRIPPGHHGKDGLARVGDRGPHGRELHPLPGQVLEKRRGRLPGLGQRGVLIADPLEDHDHQVESAWLGPQRRDHLARGGHMAIRVEEVVPAQTGTGHDQTGNGPQMGVVVHLRNTGQRGHPSDHRASCRHSDQDQACGHSDPAQERPPPVMRQDRSGQGPAHEAQCSHPGHDQEDAPHRVLEQIDQHEQGDIEWVADPGEYGLREDLSAGPDQPPCIEQRPQAGHSGRDRGHADRGAAGPDVAGQGQDPLHPQQHGHVSEDPTGVLADQIVSPGVEELDDQGASQGPDHQHAEEPRDQDLTRTGPKARGPSCEPGSRMHHSHARTIPQRHVSDKS